MKQPQLRYKDLASMPQRGQAAIFVTLIGALLVLTSWFLPYVSFDPAPLGQEGVYPQGRSFSVAATSALLSTSSGFFDACIVASVPMLTFWYVVATGKAWSYWAAWIAVVWTLVALAEVLGSLIPGWSGYFLWFVNINGDIPLSFDQSEMDAWDKATDLSIPSILLYLVCHFVLLAGAWYLRALRKEEKQQRSEAA